MTVATKWERFQADAWTDDWANLCDALDVDYSCLDGGDLNSRQFAKLVRLWLNETPGAADRLNTYLEESG